MELHNVISAQYCDPAPSLSIMFVIDATIEGDRDEFIFVSTADDWHGLSPDVAAWLLSHPEFPIAPYVEPEPAPPIDPLTIDLPRREFRRALLHNGMDTADVLAVIGAITDPVEREEMTIWWEDTQMFQRQFPVLVQMVAAAGLTPEQGNDIWAYGVSLLQDEAP